jgi:MFS family permease
MTKEEKFVIFASSLGTIFEWYDFHLYATLAPFFASLFFPPGNDTAPLLSAFATYAAGFLVRPFGALMPRVPHHALAGGGAEQRQQQVFIAGIAQEAVGERRLRALPSSFIFWKIGVSFSRSRM